MSDGGTVGAIHREVVMDSIGTILREFRVAAGQSQRELGEAIGLPAQRIGDLERDQRRLTLREAARIANALRLTDADWLEVRRRAAA